MDCEVGRDDPQVLRVMRDFLPRQLRVARQLFHLHGQVQIDRLFRWTDRLDGPISKRTGCCSVAGRKPREVGRDDRQVLRDLHDLLPRQLHVARQLFHLPGQV